MPENSLPAFEHALNLGVTFLELDVVISKDLQVVVSHEATFNPEICNLPTDSNGAPNNLFQRTLSEIQKVDCGLQPHPRFPEQQRLPATKPTLRAVFEMAEGYYARTGKPVYYNIEIKSTPEGDGVFHPEPNLFARLVVDEILRSGAAQRCMVQSFDLRALRAVKTLEPSLPLAVLAEATEDPLEKVNQLGFQPQVLSPDHTVVNPALIQAAHARHLQIIPWTVNDPVRAQELRSWGVDGLITDYPDRI
jgi:glycerophosphoryl diester phosphodiesterase